MSMISDLVDRLRVESKSMGKYGVDYMATLLMQASDTIIMLSEKARADRPQGEWIFDSEILCSDIGVYSAGYRCSVCGKDYFKVEGMRFCPSCGARMKGTNDDL